MNPVPPIPSRLPPIPSRPWIASTRPDGRGMPPVIASPAPGGDGPARMRPSHRMIFEVLLARQRAGERDTTDAEIQEALERLHAPRRFDRAWIAGRISEMKAASPALVLEAPEKRHDAHTRAIDGGVVRATHIPRQWVAGGGGAFPVIASAGAAVASDSY